MNDAAQLFQTTVEAFSLNAFLPNSHNNVMGLQLCFFGCGLWFHASDFDHPSFGMAGGVCADEQHQGGDDVEHWPCGHHRHAPAFGLDRQAERIGGILLAGHFHERTHGQPVKAVQSAGLKGGQLAAQV